MKVFVKTLRGTHFEIEVNHSDTVSKVKKNIETIQGIDVYPAVQQMLIYQGKVLKDVTTLEENKVIENSFIVIMRSKTKISSGEGSTTSTTTLAKTNATPTTTFMSTTPQVLPSIGATSALITSPIVSPPPISSSSVVQATSNAFKHNLEETIQQILNMGRGSWDRDTVVRALRAAYNNPERAIEYLNFGIPEKVEAPSITQELKSGQLANHPVTTPQVAQPTFLPSSGPNVHPLNLFPQSLPNVGSRANPLGFLRNYPQFQAFRSMVHANPQMLQPTLLKLGKQNPHIMRLIQEHYVDFLRLISEPIERSEGNTLGQLIGAMPQVTVTLEEQQAIERLEAMGFDRATVLEVYFAFNKNEEIAANYLLDHMQEFDE